MPAVIARVAVFRADLFQLVRQQLVVELGRDLAAVGQCRAVAEPLPELRARDLRRREIFHQMVDRLRAGPAEPRFKVAHAHMQIPPHPALGDRAVQRGQQVRRGDLHVVETMQLVRPLHVLPKRLQRRRHEPRVRDPRAIVPIRSFAHFVGVDFCQRGLVGRRITLDRNLRRHPTHRVGAVPVTHVDHVQRIRAEKRHRHRDQRAVGKQILRPIPEFLHKAEHVVPAPAVEPGGVLTQLIQNLLGLDAAENRLDQHRRAHRPARNPQRGLRMDKHVVPQARLQVALHLRQVKIRPAAPRDQLLGVVEKIEPPVEERRRDPLPAEQRVLLLHVPPARPRHDRRELVLQ